MQTQPNLDIALASARREEVRRLAERRRVGRDGLESRSATVWRYFRYGQAADEQSICGARG